MKITLDHLVIAASSLAEGALFIEQLFGVEPSPGGKHPLMGTHNTLLSLGSSCYLEVIAIDPEAPTPAIPRWFGLDSVKTREQLSSGPRLITWVARTENFERTASQADFATGEPMRLSRGDLSWIFGVHSDGGLKAHGLLPHLIQWLTLPLPASRLVDHGCRLHCLEGHHPSPERLQRSLQSIGCYQQLQLHPLRDMSQPWLSAVLNGPKGTVRLNSCPHLANHEIICPA